MNPTEYISSIGYPSGNYSNNEECIYWRKTEYTEKTIDLPQVTDKFYHIQLYQVHLTMGAIQTHNISDWHRLHR
jgi:hypothetical protein